MANVTISKFSDGTNTGYIASQAYFSCSTPAGTAAKVATSSDSVTFTDTSLVAGVTVHVYFTYANTATGTLTLKIGNSTAKNIAGTVSWGNGSVVSFTFGGTNWYQNDAYASRLGESTVGSNRLPIYLSNGIPYECYPGDAYLQWGGRNLTNTNSPLDAALISTLGADRFAFIKPSAITVEYSQDGGTAWSEYSLSDDTKARIFAPGIGASLYLGAHGAAGSGTADDQLRITVDTYTASIYTTIYKWVCYMATNGHSNCTWSLQLRTTANVINNVDTWVDGFQDVSIEGWTGINITNYQKTIGSNAPTSATNTQYRQFRLIFKQGAASAGHASSSILYIMGYGGVGWATPSNMAKYNSLYSYDSSQNATFPANVTASKFITRNGTSSQFVKGDGSLDSNSYEPLSNKVTSITSSSTDTEYPSAKAVYDLISSSSNDVPVMLVTANYTYDGGGHYTFTGYSVTAPTVSELYNYTQTSGNRTINFNFADKGEYGQNDGIEACVGAIGLFNNDTSPTAVTIFAYLLGFGASEVDFQIYLTDDASTTTVTKTVYSSVTSISSSSTDTQYPTAKAVYDLISSSSSDVPTMLVTANYTYEGGGEYSLTGYSVTGPTVSELYNYAQTSGNRMINFNYRDTVEYGQNYSIAACTSYISRFNYDTPPTAAMIVAHMPGGAVYASDFYVNLTDDASTTTVTKTVCSSVTSISSSSTDNQYPTAKAVYDLFASITDADSVSY